MNARTHTFIYHSFVFSQRLLRIPRLTRVKTNKASICKRALHRWQDWSTCPIDDPLGVTGYCTGLKTLPSILSLRPAWPTPGLAKGRPLRQSERQMSASRLERPQGPRRWVKNVHSSSHVTWGMGWEDGVSYVIGFFSVVSYPIYPSPKSHKRAGPDARWPPVLSYGRRK